MAQIKLKAKLLEVSKRGNMEDMVRLLDQIENIDETDKHGVTLLMSASQRGPVELVKLLLDRGARVNLADKHGYTPLMLASDAGQPECVKLLMDRGAQINVLNMISGWNSLMWASYEGNVECVKVLLSNKDTLVNVQDRHGWTALMVASHGKQVECLKLLLDRDGQVNMQDKDGFTALMRASEAGTVECAKLLVDRGANINLKNKDGLNALMLAEKRVQMGCVKFLSGVIGQSAEQVSALRVEADGGDATHSQLLVHMDNTMNMKESSILVEGDLIDVKREVIDVAAKWRDLGLALRLKAADLDTIGAKHPMDPTECLTETLLAWLQLRYDKERYGPPNWKLLCKAVRDRVGGNNPALADAIAKSHSTYM